MKIWHLENEYDAFIASVCSGREGRKADVGARVARIKAEVLEKGDAALVAYGRQLDGWTRDYPLKVSREEIEAAASRVARDDLAALRAMVRNVTLFHRGQKGRARTYRRQGLKVTERPVPVERVLVYVPGGTAPYPSSLIMGVVPAQIAGVKEIYATTPGRDGAVNPHIAAAARILGITDLYRIGGAQAIYAFAYGAGSIPRVDMIVGPGNAYVEEAKRDVYGRVGIDMLAGPSELVILAAERTSPKVLACDLISQAEHDKMATVGLFSPSQEELYEVLRCTERLIASDINEKRRGILETAWHANGFLVHYTRVEDAVRAIDRIAPEHLEVIGDEKLAESIRYAGITYVGPLTPVAMGDYAIGTNHVLPTGGAGRFSSGLSVERFTKRQVLVKIEGSFLKKHGEWAARLAGTEGLYAHGEAIRARKELTR
jgi:histidinol dehydrogenase